MTYKEMKGKYMNNKSSNISPIDSIVGCNSPYIKGKEAGINRLIEEKGINCFMSYI